jgi:hypothetical protein
MKAVSFADTWKYEIAIKLNFCLAAKYLSVVLAG